MRTNLNIARASFKPAPTIFTAALALAITFTFSCSSGGNGDDDGSGGGNGGGSGGKGNDIANYRTVKIGEQTWMAENLNYNVAGSVCYDNSEANCNKYGRLYDWSTAMALPSSCNSTSCSSQVGAKHRGICPSGWHIPSAADWNALMKAANPSCSDNSGCAIAGKILKATSGWNDYDGASGNGTDSLGFSALPGGRGDSDDGFDLAGHGGYWWSASEDNSYYAYYRYMLYNSEIVIWNNNDKSLLRSVRCLQD